MGIDIRTATVLSAAKSLGADFARTAMIGRQSLFDDHADFSKIYSLHGATAPPSSDYAEPFLQALGAESVHSFDASEYEGSTHIHDFNLPIPAKFKERYSLVIDGGTLEHIFNAPQAFRNCMEMLEVGGFFVSSSPCNNQMGHGFWQFSPELAYRIFSPANGFEPLGVFVQESDLTLWKETNGPFYLVRDPAELGERVTLRNNRTTFLHVIARRSAIKPIFDTIPQQSDYSATWEQGAPRSSADGFSPIRLAKMATPAIFKRPFKPTFPAHSYTPVTSAKVMRGQFRQKD